LWFEPDGALGLEAETQEYGGGREDGPHRVGIVIKPVLQDEAFLADVHAAPSNRLNLWWLGQSGYLVQWQGHHLLIDPYLSDSLTRKYADTDKPHVRMTERVIAPEKLDFIEVVTSSHNHTDHLDGETLRPLLGANPTLTVLVPAANVPFAANRLEVQPERLTSIHADGNLITVGPFTFHAIPSAHEAIETDENGDHKFVGYIIEVGGKTIYHSGDACPYSGLEERLKKWRIDLALLPINGRDPARGVAGNLTSDEAALLGKAIGARLVIPCHYEMFEFNTISSQEFVTVAKALNCPYQLLRAGERASL
jgi:L-ascorbate metabolism protein UlaG (beta-lactamase superfamily)